METQQNENCPTCLFLSQTRYLIFSPYIKFILSIICNSKINARKFFKSTAKALKIDRKTKQLRETFQLPHILEYSIPCNAKFNVKSGDLSLRADRGSREHVIIIGQGSQCLATFCGDQGISPRPGGCSTIVCPRGGFHRDWRDEGTGEKERESQETPEVTGPVFAVKFQRSIKHRSRAERYFIPSSLFPNQNFLWSSIHTNARTRLGRRIPRSVHFRCSRDGLRFQSRDCIRREIVKG